MSTSNSMDSDISDDFDPNKDNEEEFCFYCGEPLEDGLCSASCNESAADEGRDELIDEMEDELIGDKE
jgi:hypothetical protein